MSHEPVSVRMHIKSSDEGQRDGSEGKGVSHQSDDLNLEPGSQMVEGENNSYKF